MTRMLLIYREVCIGAARQFKRPTQQSCLRICGLAKARVNLGNIRLRQAEQAIKRCAQNTIGGEVADNLNLSGIKVMVIDDSNTIRRSAEIFLQQSGCETILAEDGFDALAKIADCRPSIIFLDVMMPRLDGYQTCALIKKNPQFKHTPIIMLSSKDGLFDKARGRMVGSSEYLTKPFTKDTLLTAVRRYADTSQPN